MKLWPKQVCFVSQKISSTIQYGYKKCGTHAQVFLQTRVNWNSMNKIRQRVKSTEEGGKKSGVYMEYGKKYYSKHERRKVSMA